MNQPTILNFDASTVDPNFGAAGFFPVSDDKGHLVMITADNGFKNMSTGKGQFLELELTAQEGALAGMKAPLRLNLMHESGGAVAAASSQLSAIGHVVGVLRIGTTADIMGKPFRVVSELQDRNKPDGYTQLAANGIRDTNGNKPGKSGQGPQTASPAPQMTQPAAPQGGGWQGGQDQQTQPAQGQQGGQNWQAGQAPQGAFGGQQPEQGQQAQNPQAFQQQQAPAQGGQPGWSQQGGQGQGAPSWAQGQGQ